MRNKWLGFIVMGIVVLVAFTTVGLAFKHVLSAEQSFSIFRLCFFIFMIGFVLHMIVAVRQMREKKGRQNLS